MVFPLGAIASTGKTATFHLGCRMKHEWKAPVYASLSLTFALLGDTFLYSFLPIYATTVYLPVVWIGILLSINRFVRIVSTAWIVRLLEEFGFRRLTLLAATLAILTTAGYGLGWGVIGWLVLRITWGLSFSVLRIATLTYALDHPKKGFSLGFTRSLQEMGPLLALVLGPWLLERTAPTSTFLLLAAGSLPAFFFALRLPPRKAEPSPPRQLGFGFPSMVNQLVFLASFAGDGLVVVLLGSLLLSTYPNVSAADGTAWAASFLIFRRVGAIVLSPLGGWLADRYGFKRVYAGTLLPLGIALLLLSLGWTVAGLVLLFSFYSVNAALAFGSGGHSNADQTKAVAHNAAWRDAGAALGALVGGFLLVSPFTPLCLLTLGLALLAMLVYYIHQHRPLTRFVAYKNRRAL